LIFVSFGTSILMSSLNQFSPVFYFIYIGKFMPKRFSRVHDESPIKDSSDDEYSSDVANESMSKVALIPPEVDLLLDIEIDEVPQGNFISSKVVQISAEDIVPSPWADRSPSSYADNAFDDLRTSIRAGGTNTVPIKVRPIRAVGVSNTTGLPSQAYEIVYGHRRHRACLLAEVPVTAIVVQICDRDLIMEMFKENSLRKDLSPIEQAGFFIACITPTSFLNRKVKWRMLFVVTAAMFLAV
jgi:ParB/RepB/Spo0J family partition protein